MVMPSVLSDEAKIQPIISSAPELMCLTILLKHLPRVVVMIK